MKSILVVFLIFSFTILFGQDCIELPNGRYKVVPNKEFPGYSEYEIEIIGEEVTAFQNEEVNVYKIIRSYCAFRFESNIKIDEDELTELDKILNKNPPHYHLLNEENGTYDFIFRSDLHSQIYSGKFVKIAD